LGWVMGDDFGNNCPGRKCAFRNGSGNFPGHDISVR
jgi:hypothetical protein